MLSSAGILLRCHDKRSIFGFLGDDTPVSIQYFIGGQRCVVLCSVERVVLNGTSL